MKAKAWSKIVKVLAGSAFALTLFGCSNQAAPKSNAVKTHYVVKNVGVKKLAAAKAKRKILKKEKSKEEAEYEQLKDQLKDDKDKQAEAEKEAAAQQAQVAAQTKGRSQAIQSAASVNRGNMNTAQTGRIVGNSRSHIYHVPGQRGYRMNSANAVYFNSEQAAQAAGYRKALR